MRRRLRRLLDNRRDSVFFHTCAATRPAGSSKVNFKTKTAARTDLGRFGNHWPSSSGGQFESARYRAVVGERSATSTNASSRCTDRGLPWVQPAMCF